LSHQFEQRQVKKTYLAVVSGKLTLQAGEIDLPLICDWPNRPKQMVDHVRGKPAHTCYWLLNYDIETNTSRVELKPTTGRTHQLRVHMQAIGHPILGDDLYADQETCSKAERLLLHASALQFTHPVGGEAVCFTLPAQF
jgi:tRNA pseudouridine32 synthase/23S rRNA pseudouridine746 synthase